MLIGFDIDDTLLDHRGAERRAARAFFRAHAGELRGAHRDETTFAERWQALSEAYVARYLRRELSFDAQRRARIRAVFDSILEDTAADSLFREYLTLFESSWGVFSDVFPALDALRPTARLVVITNGDPSQQRRKLHALGVSDYFEAVITPDDAGVAKPYPGIFATAARRLGVEQGPCLYVGDDLDLDARAARTAGWLGVWLNRGPQDGRRREILEVPTLAALPAITRDLRSLSTPAS